MTNQALVTNQTAATSGSTATSNQKALMTTPDLHTALPLPSSGNAYGFNESSPDSVSVPYAGQSRMQLNISGCADARLRIDPEATELLTVNADGMQTRLRVSPTELRLSWPMTFGSWLRTAVSGAHRDIEIILHPAVEWTLLVRGGLSRFDADLAAGKLARVEIRGGMSHAQFDLPAPTSPVPVRVSGGVSGLTLRRPAATGVSLAISGGVSSLHLDEQQFGSIGGGSRLVSGAVNGDLPQYSVEINGGASSICVTGH